MKPLFSTDIEVPGSMLAAIAAPVSGAGYLPATANARPAGRAIVAFDDKAIDALGSKAGVGLSGVSKRLLMTVRASDADAFGAQLNQLIATSRGLDPKKLQSTGLVSRAMNLFGNVKENILAQYSVVESRMDVLVEELNQHATLHQNRDADYELLYNDNFAYHEELESEVKQGEVWAAEISSQLAEQPTATSAFAAQNLAELKRRFDRVEKKVDDLRRGMLLAKQMAPQIRLSQDNARSLSTTFTDITVVGIPAWRNVFSLYLLQEEAKLSAKVGNAALDATDAAFRAQADMLQENTESIAHLKQRSIVSLETFQQVNTKLMATVDSLVSINEAGRARRKAELPMLEKLEQELISRFVPKTIQYGVN